MSKHLLRKFLLVLLITSSNSNAAELVHQFNSPAFNGVGYSTHILTIETIEAQRRQKLKDEAKAAADAETRAKANTNLSKFLVNVESRIYAQMSKQLADQMFAEGGASSGTMNFQGTTIQWTKTYMDDKGIEIAQCRGLTSCSVVGSLAAVKMNVSDASQTTEILVPIGTFGF